MKKGGVILLFLIVLLSFASAQTQQTLGDQDGFLPAQDINLIQVCSNCSYVNVTNVKLGNGSIATVNQTMSKDDTFYNLTLSSNLTVSLGEYIINWVADPNGITTAGNYNLFVRNNAKFLTTAESIVLIILIILSLLTFVFFVYLSFVIPFKDTRDQKGALTRLIPAKYLKLFSILLSWGSLVWFLSILTSVVNNFSSLQSTQTLFSNLYVFIYWIAFSFLVLISFVLIVMIYIDIFIPLIKMLLGRAFGSKR